MLHGLLNDSAASLRDIDAISVVAGPGSFTGLRIGIGVAQGLSLAHNIPVICHSSLALLAYAAYRRHGGKNWVASINSNNKEIYLGFFEIDPEQGALPRAKELVTTVDRLQPMAGISDNGGDWAAVGDGWEAQAAMSKALELYPGVCIPTFEFEIEDQCAQAEIDFSLGKFSAGELALPNYVKEQMDYS